MNGDFREGGCGRGAVRCRAKGQPVRIGLGHRLNCRKANASAFLPFAAFLRDPMELKPLGVPQNQRDRT